MTSGFLPGQAHDHQHMRCSAPGTSDNFTIFEGTSEIQRMIIGRAVTGLDVR
jgi:alkylation response protein AidB-like acyl-CoA dehydrogenase